MSGVSAGQPRPAGKSAARVTLCPLGRHLDVSVLSMRPLLRTRQWATARTLAARWAPFVLLLTGAAARDTRQGVAMVLLLGLAAALLVDRFRPLPEGRRALPWAAALPVGLGLAWGTITGPVALPDLGSCADPLSPPAAWRALEALVVLGATAALTPIGGSEPLLLRRPRDARVVALAVLAPVAAIPAVLLGPPAAGPFFGEVNVAFPLASFLPAAVMALANAALEEVSYRGALMGWGGRAIGPGAALVVQALVFGFAHWGPDVQAGALLILASMAASGVVLGIVARRTGSLLLPFAIHAAVDIPLYHALACRLG